MEEPVSINPTENNTPNVTLMQNTTAFTTEKNLHKIKREALPEKPQPAFTHIHIHK